MTLGDQERRPGQARLYVPSARNQRIAFDSARYTAGLDLERQEVAVRVHRGKFELRVEDLHAGAVLRHGVLDVLECARSTAAETSPAVD
jgi:hypothetical protein